jgi:hypothetical protein
VKKHERALLKTPKLPGNDALGLYQGYLTLLQPAAIKEANQKLKDRIRQLERELEAEKHKNQLVLATCTNFINQENELKQ